MQTTGFLLPLSWVIFIEEYCYRKAALLDRVTGFIDKPVAATPHSMFTDIVNQLPYCNANVDEKINSKTISNDRIRQLQILSIDLFGDIPDTNIFPLKVHMLNRIAKVVPGLGKFQFLDALSVERMNYIITSFIRNT